MDFTSHEREVSSAKTEADLGNNWLSPLIRNINKKGRLALHWEAKNQNGRRDLALVDKNNGRIVCVIELKNPQKITNAELEKEIYLTQIHRYVFSQNYWRDGYLHPAIGVLTNGRKVILVDGRKNRKDAIRDAKSESNQIDISTRDGFKAFTKLFENLSRGKRAHKVHSEIETDSRPLTTEEDVNQKLTKELLTYYRTFKQHGLNALDATLQMFLVAVLRDCGYLPTSLMDSCYNPADPKKQRNWSGLTSALNSVLSANFKRLPNDKEIIDLIYLETTQLCARLDVVPPDCLGLVYEKLLHEISKSDAVTSYYTPYKLSKEVIEKLEIDISSKLLDPSCGSATFLTTAIDHIFADMHFENSKMKMNGIFKYIKNNIRGVDRDENACQVSKAMLLASAAKNAGIDYIKTDNIKLPNLKNTILCDDFFLWEPKGFVPSHVVGNAPWGPVDSKKKEDILSSKIRSKIQLESKFETYFNNVDVSCLFLEQINNRFPNAKVGMLIKQQVLHNISKKQGSFRFIPWAKKENYFFYDYGDMEFFNNESSLTAIAFKGIPHRSFIYNKSVSYPAISKNMVEITKYFEIFEAFYVSETEIFENVAERLKNDTKKFSFIRGRYPRDAEARHFKLPSNLDKICFIPNGAEAPQEFVDELTASEKIKLARRPQASSKYKYNFIGTEGLDYYKFDDESGVRIVMPMSYNPLRNKAMIDEFGVGIPIKEHSCVIIPKEGTPREYVYALLGWLNSKHFYFECLRVGLKKQSSGRMKFQGNDKRSLCIPNEILNKTFAKYIQRVLKIHVTERVLDSLDEKILNQVKNKKYIENVISLIERKRELKRLNEIIVENGLKKAA